MLVLLDRDGVLNEDRSDFVKTPAELVLIEGAAEALARLCGAGHTSVIVTNQSCIGRGLMSEADLADVHAALHRRVRAAGGEIAAIFVCPDAPWAATRRRKPAPGMIEEALAQFAMEARDAVMIGDSLRDLQAAAAVGVRRILVRCGKGRSVEADGIPATLAPVAVYDDLAAAADALIAENAAAAGAPP